MTPEQLKHRNARIAEGQARAWRNPEIRQRRSTAIAQAFDDALFRAVMREKSLRRGARPPLTVKKENL